jgi:uncharacterized membrane protein YkoI
MKTKTVVAASVVALLFVAARGVNASPDDDAKLLAALPKSKLTLAQGIEQAAAKEAVISAKFELEEGKLSLSVYTVEKGLGSDAEHNVLKELAGSPEGDKWHPETEVFKDIPHVSRASQQLAIVAMSPVTLLDIIKKAGKDHPGTVYSVIPLMLDRKPVYVVKIAADGKSTELHYDALTGSKK